MTLWYHFRYVLLCRWLGHDWYFLSWLDRTEPAVVKCNRCQHHELLSS